MFYSSEKHGGNKDKTLNKNVEVKQIFEHYLNLVKLFFVTFDILVLKLFYHLELLISMYELKIVLY